MPIIKHRFSFSLNALTFSAAGFLTLGLVSPDSEAQARLAMGGTHSGSAFYSYQVAVVSDWNDNVDGVNMSIQELGGASASTQGLLRGEVDMGIAVTSSDHQAMQGEGEYGSPAENLRTLYFFAPLPLNWVVSADTDIHSLEDLEGQDFNSGGRGTATEGQTETVLEILGIEPEYYRAGASDALDAYQNRRLDAFVKAGLHPDGYIQQAHSSRPVRLLSMSQEQAEQVADARPYFSVGEIDAQDHYGEQQSPLVTIQTGIGINTTSELDEETAYGIVAQAFSEAGIQAAADGYAPAAAIDPVQLTLNASVAPLHAGVVRYLEEQGHDVPERLIPPEYAE
ncbi:TAXI family TRAP transporter solute-binding subunit [Billgrantia diversa]|uniref:TAXI family TRAP transporter solute-binding subunit n=1 Tax=Halomonas sp. MCCC 1A13316 TaxID=2733487 RepID=UPI0018A5372D|nr:TAXI family TRAP transporter solute-binding subunit [Halomonas sp. MCCC 1A13316]QOR37939.1 TAXI family TRAP transporter solute-binding subunit [Halomonas sp. MCCC 1A13316]